ncbi:MAG: N-acetyltransferase [Atopostipes suicloacalis]|nr:N-acetyltransferase [Atopostipes suicloacalis]
MEIKLARKSDLNKMRKVFNHGRKVQLESGNLTQWKEGYPTDTLILDDIEKGAAHLCVNDSDEILAVFSVFTGEDPTYTDIKGQWLNQEEYATIHRIASTGKVPGVGQYCISWVINQHQNIRIDTHHKNKQMKHILKKLGFQYCGIIYLENGDARDAYQYESSI